jgi:hypothetical protein
MYRVFPVEDGYEIFWCPSEHEKIALNRKKVYSTDSAAYRRVKQLNDALKEKQEREAKQKREPAA